MPESGTPSDQGHMDQQEMIADLKADSARWEADVARRADLGYPRGSYIQDVNVSHHTPNSGPANYAASAIHEVRQQQGPSPTFSAAPVQQPYMDHSYSQSPYSGSQSAPYNNPTTYGSTHSPYGSGQAPYPPPQVTYGGSQPIVTAADIHPSYTYTASGYGGGYEGGGRNAPRYTGPGYDAELDYSSPQTTGMAYPSTTAPDPRIGMESRYTPEYERSRPQATRGERDPHRRR